MSMDSSVYQNSWSTEKKKNADEAGLLELLDQIKTKSAYAINSRRKARFEKCNNNPFNLLVPNNTPELLEKTPSYYHLKTNLGNISTSDKYKPLRR